MSEQVSQKQFTADVNAADIVGKPCFAPFDSKWHRYKHSSLIIIKDCGNGDIYKLVTRDVLECVTEPGLSVGCLVERTQYAYSLLTLVTLLCLTCQNCDQPVATLGCGTSDPSLCHVTCIVRNINFTLLVFSYSSCYMYTATVTYVLSNICNK